MKVPVRDSEPGRPKKKSVSHALADTLSDDELQRLDPVIRSTLRAIKARDWRQLEMRFGIRVADPGVVKPPPQFFPITVRLKSAFAEVEAEILQKALDKLGVLIPPACYRELKVHRKLRILPGRLEVRASDPSVDPDGIPLDTQLREILKVIGGGTLSFAVHHGKCLEQSIGDIGLPVDRQYKGKELRGEGVVIGIIDDGCPFAHLDFLRRKGSASSLRFESRILYLWDQTKPPSATDPPNSWQANLQFLYGRELTRQAIEKAINDPVSPPKPHITAADWIDENAVYEYLGYPLGITGDLASHGARVMGIAAGNGRSLMGQEGVAPEADIIFVQLPPVLVDSNDETLSTYIQHAVKYVFMQAEALKKSAVVNISYGGYRGPHDGSSEWESYIDSLLDGVSNRAVVVSAGNGFEGDCHASRTVAAGRSFDLHWIIKPEDPTFNDLEVWYDGGCKFDVSLISPDGTLILGPYGLGASEALKRADGRIIGDIDHGKRPNLDVQASITLRPSVEEIPSGPTTLASAAAGPWTIRLENKGSASCTFHAWIQRDDLSLGGRRQQSRFDPNDASPRFTIGDLATGRHTISVGAHNVATQELCGYSACGPTRPTGGKPGRKKPDICGPAEELATGGGVLATSSARSPPTRINGTSASAPHVAGLVALILEYARKHAVGAPVALTSVQIRDALMASGNPAPLRPSRRQLAQPLPIIKQPAVWMDLVGGGKVNFLDTMELLFDPPP